MIRYPSIRWPRTHSLSTRMLAAALVLTPSIVCAKDVSPPSSIDSRSWAEFRHGDGENRWLEKNDRDDNVAPAPGSFQRGSSHGRSPWLDDQRDTPKAHPSAPSAVAYFEIDSNDKAGNHSLTVPVSPVPEPQTYVLLLAGLGVMVSVIRRQRLSN